MTMHKRLLPIMLSASLGIVSNIAAAGVLHPDSSENINLVGGEYAFAGAHSAGDIFLDEFQFSLANAGNVTATVNNAPLNLPSADTGSNLLNDSLLMLSLFDHDGNFISAAGAGGTLTANGLNSGMTYTLAVSGKASGIFGGVYDGKLDVDPPAVPLPPTLPFFATALLALTLPRKRNYGQAVSTAN